MPLYVTSTKAWMMISKSSYQRCSVKKVFLEIYHNSQENTCARVSFLIKLQKQVFSCEFCEISKNTFYCRTPLVAASGYRLGHPFISVIAWFIEKLCGLTQAPGWHWNRVENEFDVFELKIAFDFLPTDNIILNHKKNVRSHLHHIWLCNVRSHLYHIWLCNNVWSHLHHIWLCNISHYLKLVIQIFFFSNLLPLVFFLFPWWFFLFFFCLFVSF